jgi:hypothetical protein
VPAPDDPGDRGGRPGATPAPRPLTVENGGDLRSLGLQGRQRRPHRLDRGARLARLADEVGGGATEQVVVEQAALAGGRQPDCVERPVPVDGALPRQPLDPLEVGHGLRVGLPEVGPVEDHPEIGFAAQALHPVRVEFGDEPIRIEVGAFGRLPVEHPPNPRLSVAAGGEPRGKKPRSCCRSGSRWRGCRGVSPPGAWRDADLP